MGIFSGINNLRRKTEAAVVVQIFLERQQSAGLLDVSAASFANQLVQTVWRHEPAMFDGSQGPRPHKISLAAMALSTGAGLTENSELNRIGLNLALGHLLEDVQRNGGNYLFNGLDHALLGSAASTFEKNAKEFDGPIPFLE